MSVEAMAIVGMPESHLKIILRSATKDPSLETLQKPSGNLQLFKHRNSLQ
jgi:hypothetical protein